MRLLIAASFFWRGCNSNSLFFFVLLLPVFFGLLNLHEKKYHHRY